MPTVWTGSIKSTQNKAGRVLRNGGTIQSFHFRFDCFRYLTLGSEIGGGIHAGGVLLNTGIAAQRG